MYLMVLLLWIRHGYSCANYYIQLPKNERPNQKIFADALLTNYSFSEVHKKNYWNNISKKLKKLKLKIVPIVFTSTLSRAIQTAKSIIPPKFEIIPISYISELYTIKRYNSYNISQNRKVVEKKLGYPLQVLASNNPYSSSGSVKNPQPDQKLFFEYGLPSIIKELESKGIKLYENSVLIFVSHGEFIKSITGCKVGNLGAVLQSVEYNKFKILFNGYPKPDLDTLELDDIENCLN